MQDDFQGGARARRSLGIEEETGKGTERELWQLNRDGDQGYGQKSKGCDIEGQFAEMKGKPDACSRILAANVSEHIIVSL